MHHTRRGFTWLELAIVLAVVAVLAAILYPVLTQSDSKPPRVSCLSNEKQLGLGLLQYTEDNDNRLPSGCVLRGVSGGGAGWAGQLYPYVKSSGIFLCPSDPNHSPVSADVTLNGKPAEATLQPISYALNENLAGRALHGKILSLRAPSSIVLLCEAEGADALLTDPAEGVPANQSLSPAADGLDTLPGDMSDQPDGTSSGHPFRYATGELGHTPPANLSADFTGPQGIHADGSNFVLCDFHARYFPGSSVSPGRAAAPGQYQNQFPGRAASIANLKDAAGHPFAATFSPT